MKHRLSTFIAFVLIFTGCGALFDKDHMELKRSIQWYEDALIKVYNQLDIKPLDGLASEREMTRVNMILMNLAREKKVMESKLVELKVLEISLESGNEAEVTTEEKWRYRYLRKGTNFVIKPWTDAEYRMKYKMVKSKGLWIVGLSTMRD